MASLRFYRYGDEYWRENFGYPFDAMTMKAYLEQSGIADETNWTFPFPPDMTPQRTVERLTEAANIIVDAMWMRERLKNRSREPARVTIDIPPENARVIEDIDHKLVRMDRCHGRMPYYPSIVKMVWASGYGLRRRGTYSNGVSYLSPLDYNKPFTDEGQDHWVAFVTSLEDEAEFLAQRAYESVSRYEKCLMGTFGQLNSSVDPPISETTVIHSLRIDGPLVLQSRCSRMFEDVTAALVSCATLDRANETWLRMGREGFRQNRRKGWSASPNSQTTPDSHELTVIRHCLEQAVNQPAWARASKALEDKPSPFSPREPDPDAETNTPTMKDEAMRAFLESRGSLYFGNVIHNGSTNPVSHVDCNPQLNHASSVAANLNKGSLQGSFGQPGQGSQQ